MRGDQSGWTICGGLWASRGKMCEILGAWGECRLDRKNVVIRDTKGRDGDQSG